MVGLLIVGLLTGCAENELTNDMEDSSEIDDNSSYTPDTGANEESDVDTDVSAEPEWWTLDVSLQITDGVPVIEESAIMFSLLNGDLDALCSANATLSDGLPEAIPSDDETDAPFEGLYAWWTLTAGAVDDGCVGYVSPLPNTFGLGVGTMNPDIEARYTGDSSNAASAIHLNGAYAILDDDAPVLYVFGVAGTSAAYSGESLRIESAPIPDGRWIFTPYSTFEYSQ